MNQPVRNIMIVGVGGQGSLLASKLLGHLLLNKGFDVKVSEVHGMSQRLIVSFELLEAARWLPYLKEGGQIVTNTQMIDPMPVITGAAQYPEHLEEKIAEKARLDALDCLELARQAGSAKAVNIVLMGRLSRYFDFPEEDWLESIEACVPARFVDLNKTAFSLGRNHTPA